MTHRMFKELARRPLILDGAMGTSIHNCDCDLHRDYLGKENCTEILVRTRPEVIQGIHETFLEAGADGVETDSFGANKLVFAEFDLVAETRALNKEAAEIARARAQMKAGLLMRKFGIRFAQHHPDGETVRRRFISVKSIEDWRNVLDAFYGEAWAADDSPMTRRIA